MVVLVVVISIDYERFTFVFVFDTKSLIAIRRQLDGNYALIIVDRARAEDCANAPQAR